MLTHDVQSLDPSIFRAYDIRGIVDKTLTHEGVYLIGKAVGSLVREQGGTQIYIARDGRLSGPSLSTALTEGILSSGCDVIDLGVVPTPLLYFATHVLNERSGVMLTGSHNPAEYNGLKIVANGKTIAEEGIKDLYRRITEKQFTEGAGIRHELSIIDRYISRIVADIKLTKKLKMVIDAGSGVTGVVAPRLFKALDCDVEELFCEIDGRFPFHHPDPTDPKNLTDLIRVVKEKQADIGLAFDGDGDRLVAVTNTGEVIYPDRLLMLYAQSILSERKSGTIIYDVKCTYHLDKVIKAAGGIPIMWKTGHSLIKAKLAETNAELAGEMSGHFFFNDRWYGFDDALYAGARLLEILAKRSESSDAIFSAIPNSINTPELKVLVKEEEKFLLMQKLIHHAEFEDAEEMMTIDGLRVNFADGWGLVRPSNTTPYLILRFEAINENILKKIQMSFRNWMLSVKPDLVLPF